MAIKRGVSLYSYQQAQFFGEMNLDDMCRELHDNLKCSGVEIISEATIKGFPFPSKEFLADWHAKMARYDLTPVCLDGFLDVLRFRDHVMDYAEAAEWVKIELQIAHDMGFSHIRSMTGLPVEVIDRCLDTCEKLNVKLAWEIHSPLCIRPNPNMPDMWVKNPGTKVFDTVEYIKKVGTNMVGFVPDFGIFMKAPYIDSVEAFIRKLPDRGLAAEIDAMYHEVELKDFTPTLAERFGDRIDKRALGMLSGKSSAEPEDLELILPYVLSFHGKTHHMVEIPGQPGQYDDPSTRCEEVFDVLKRNNWDGFICTEFEGQRSWQDLPREQLIDEVDQVRRHHNMMKRLGAE